MVVLEAKLGSIKSFKYWREVCTVEIQYISPGLMDLDITVSGRCRRQIGVARRVNRKTRQVSAGYPRYLTAETWQGG